jgi:dihydroorotase
MLGNYLMPGAIDDQVHFRTRTHAQEMLSQNLKQLLLEESLLSSRQPNTVPNAVTQEILEQSIQLAADNSFANIHS